MVPNTTANMSKVKSMERVPLPGRTDPPITANSLKTIFKDQESIIGLTVESTMDRG